MKQTSLVLRLFLAGGITTLLIFIGLMGAKPADASAGFPIPAQATDEPAFSPINLTPIATSPSQGPWAGDPRNPNYDGRMNATMADRFAVYCKDGELQVWDGVANQKVAAVPLTRVASMRSGTALVIGSGVFLGRSNNVLVVAGPGEFVKDNLNFETCTGGKQ